jgi:hypothetical protein
MIAVGAWEMLGCLMKGTLYLREPDWDATLKQVGRSSNYRLQAALTSSIDRHLDMHSFHSLKARTTTLFEHQDGRCSRGSMPTSVSTLRKPNQWLLTVP